ncbi:MAG: ribonuclease Z [Bacteroidales bacterium]|jgi:ribonuclease Z|nr:ribonuclease Z [Bacteroidales bacterium]
MFLRILGCGSATPTTLRNPSAFLLTFENKKRIFLIDCSEGTQLRMRANGVRMQNITHIFISHLHGDHFFGLIGLLSTQSLLGRTEPIHIFAHKPLKKIINMQLKIEKSRLTFPLIFHPLKKSKKASVIWSEKELEIVTFPLLHSIPANGFIFKEKKVSVKIKPELLAKHSLTTKQKGKVIRGHDYITHRGEVFKNKDITYIEEKIKSFSYCSDTAYTESFIDYIKGTDLLYHEATFMEDLAEVAAKKQHSTAKQAAAVALKADAKQLLIGHYSARYVNIHPLLEEAQSIFPNTIAAQEGHIEQI